MTNAAITSNELIIASYSLPSASLSFLLEEEDLLNAQFSGTAVLKKSFVVMLLENILTFNTIAKALGVPSVHLLSLLFIALRPGNV